MPQLPSRGRPRVGSMLLRLYCCAVDARHGTEIRDMKVDPAMVGLVQFTPTHRSQNLPSPSPSTIHAFDPQPGIDLSSRKRAMDHFGWRHRKTPPVLVARRRNVRGRFCAGFGQPTVGDQIAHCLSVERGASCQPGKRVRMSEAGRTQPAPLSWMRRIVAAIMSMSRIAHRGCIEMTHADPSTAPGGCTVPNLRKTEYGPGPPARAVRRSGGPERCVRRGW